MRQVNVDSVVDLYRPYLMHLPYVSEVRVGERKGRPIIQVCVFRPVDDLLVADCDRVHHMVDGYETEVVVVKNVPHSAEEVYKGDPTNE